jgi:hypothetical protein
MVRNPCALSVPLNSSNSFDVDGDMLAGPGSSPLYFALELDRLSDMRQF